MSNLDLWKQNVGKYLITRSGYKYLRDLEKRSGLSKYDSMKERMLRSVAYGAYTRDELVDRSLRSFTRTDDPPTENEVEDVFDNLIRSGFIKDIGDVYLTETNIDGLHIRGRKK